MAVRGARYCPVFVDRATRYNWVFALETLGATGIHDAFNLFHAQAERFAKCLHADCEEKLIGKTMKAYLVDPTSNSDVVSAAAGR